MYGKINEEGKLTILRDRVIVLDGRKYTNPNQAVLKRLGYKPIECGPAPIVPSGMALTVDYVEQEDCIKAVYGFVGGAI